MSALDPGSAVAVTFVPRSRTDGAVYDAPLSALEQLEASRLRLRTALHLIAHPAERRMSGPARSVFGWIGAAVRHIPGADIVIDAVRSWWRRHPLHAAGEVGGDAANEYLVPVIRRNPWSALGTAGIVGAGLAFMRPWRWLLRPAFVVGLISDIALHALRRAPMQSWLTLLVGNDRPRGVHKVRAGGSPCGHGSAEEERRRVGRRAEGTELEVVQAVQAG